MECLPFHEVPHDRAPHAFHQSVSVPVLGEGGQPRERSVAPGQMSSSSRSPPETQRERGGRAVSQEEVGSHQVGGVRTGFLCLRLNGPPPRAERTAPCRLRTGRRGRCWGRRWVPSWPSARHSSPSMPAASWHRTYSPAAGARPWAVISGSWFPVCSKQRMARWSLRFPSSSSWLWRLGVCLQDAGS